MLHLNKCLGLVFTIRAYNTIHWLHLYLEVFIMFVPKVILHLPIWKCDYHERHSLIICNLYNGIKAWLWVWIHTTYDEWIVSCKTPFVSFSISNTFNHNYHHYHYQGMKSCRLIGKILIGSDLLNKVITNIGDLATRRTSISVQCNTLLLVEKHIWPILLIASLPKFSIAPMTLLLMHLFYLFFYLLLRLAILQHHLDGTLAFLKTIIHDLSFFKIFYKKFLNPWTFQNPNLNGRLLDQRN